MQHLLSGKPTKTNSCVGRNIIIYDDFPPKKLLLNNLRILTALNADINVPFTSRTKSGQGSATITTLWLPTVVRKILLMHILLKRLKKEFYIQEINIDN